MPTILLAQEDADSREMFSALILDFFPTAHVQKVASWSELEPALASPSPISVLLADILWEEEERSAELLLLAEKFPEISFTIFGRYDLTGSLPAGYPIPLLAPDDELPLKLAENMENLSGTEHGAYSLSSPAGPHPLGRLYWAKHHQLQRTVQVLVPPSGSAVFPKAIRALARVNHPSVYSLYESIPSANRILVAQEPVIHPSLLHLRLGGEKPGLLACARLATALGSVTAEMESSAIPARLLGEYDYTLSPKGTPRLRNPAAYPGRPETSTYHNAQQLAGILEPLLPSDPKGTALLKLLRNPGTSAFDLLRQAREFERQLAEVREVHVRKEELVAAEKTLQARNFRRWAVGMSTLFLAGLGFLLFQAVQKKFFLDLPATLHGETVAVPAGQVVINGQKHSVPAFVMDRHEVTIGEYETFLQKLPGLEISNLVPPSWRNSPRTLEDFKPKDWDNILRQAKIRGRYPNDLQLDRQTISRDTPVFNVDYGSAYAFAKWKHGKIGRLPTQAEWIWAASGKDSWPYPWGTEEKNLQINLGFNAESKKIKDPTYFHVLPAESISQDRGPFGHYDLGGNLSEWVDSPAANQDLGKPAQFLGGNYLDEASVRNFEGLRLAPSGQGDPRIGFRTAH